MHKWGGCHSPHISSLEPLNRCRCHIVKIAGYLILTIEVCLEGEHNIKMQLTDTGFEDVKGSIRIPV
jgi:hypothetical protein